MADTDLQGKRVLVTGAGTGVGTGIAQAFADAGAAVAVHYSHSAAGATALVDKLRAAGGKAEAFAADFNELESTRQLADRAIEFLGGIDVLVNNAGITMNRPFEKVTPEQFDALFHVNIRAMFFLTQAVVPTMAVGGGGAVINISSVHAYAGITEHTVYAATKGAIVSFTRTLSLELSTKNIRVNAIAPGGVVVENHFKAIKNHDPIAFGQKIPAGFMAEPMDIGHLAVFLASDKARYFYGQTLVCDGGQLAYMPFTPDFHEPITDQFGRGYVPGI